MRCLRFLFRAGGELTCHKRGGVQWGVGEKEKVLVQSPRGMRGRMRGRAAGPWQELHRGQSPPLWLCISPLCAQVGSSPGASECVCGEERLGGPALSPRRAVLCFKDTAVVIITS